MRDGIHAARQPTDHRNSIASQKSSQVGSHLPPVSRDPPGADNRHRPIIFRIDRPSKIQHWRRLVDLAQSPRVGLIIPYNDPDALCLHPLHNLV
jgi:hypothetical protein